MYGCQVSLQPCIPACYVMSDTRTYTHMHIHTRTTRTHTHTHKYHMHTHTHTTCTYTHVPHANTHTPADMLQCTLPPEKPAKYHKTRFGKLGATYTCTSIQKACCPVVIAKSSSSGQMLTMTVICPSSAFLHCFSHSASRAHVRTSHLACVLCIHIHIYICKYTSGSSSNGTQKPSNVKWLNYHTKSLFPKVLFLPFQLAIYVFQLKTCSTI